jgi:hypothetical protein
MRRTGLVVAGSLLAAIAAAMAAPADQFPQRLAGRSGLSVTPVFEGWYANPDGTVSLSFGYYNRNSEEVLEVPPGPDNAVQPGPVNQGQPARFEPGRHWGVFAVKVPVGAPDVVWTLRNRDQTFTIPGHQRRNWKLDALEGEAGSGNTPPVLKLAADGPEGAGPLGVTAGPVSAAAGVPVDLTVWAHDDGRPSGSVATTGRTAVPVTVTWFKHQGPGAVSFGTPSARIPVAGGSATTAATFAEPGEYLVRVRANDASGVSGAGHAQCCWTNAFLKVTVSGH